MQAIFNRLSRHGLAICAAIVAAFLVGFPLCLFAQNSATPGEFAVTNAGAANYHIPLYSAPAAGSLDVKLALQYNSQSGNGVLGVGWNLTGISSITRCPRTIAEDGVRAGVKNDSSDVFCLDGQKMYTIAGVHGSAGAEYRINVDNYSKIIANGSSGAGPLSFTVYTKSGAILEFGGTTDSRLEHTRSADIRAWMVSSIRDRYSTVGNSNATAIYFSYSKNMALGEQLLQTVRYNNGQIKLIYEARPSDDPIIKYDDGLQLGSTNSRVAKIEIYDEPQAGSTRQLRLFKEYRLSYVQSQATKRSLITSIQECAALSGSCLPASTFSYQNTSPLNIVPGLTGASPGPLGSMLLVGDFDGKGKKSVRGFTGMEAGFLSNPFASKSVTAWDTNGDGITEVGFLSAPDDGMGTFNIQGLLQASFPSAWPIKCFTDIGGVGQINIVSGSEPIDITEAATLRYLKINGVNTQLVHNDLRWFTCINIDLNGDGVPELFFPDFGNMVSFNKDGALFSSGAASYVDWGGPYACQYCIYKAHVGDFNGDGKTDVLTGTGIIELPNFITWQVKLSTGYISDFPTRHPIPDLPMVSTPVVQAHMEPMIGNGFTPIDGGYAKVTCTGDFNGDGRTDILAGQYLYLSTGNGFYLASSSVPSVPPSVPVFCDDFNGDGLTDIYIASGYFGSDSPGARDVLSQVNTGLGYIRKITYKSITDDSVYTKYSGATMPQIDVQTPINVVSRTQSGNDAQGWNSTSYRYEGLRADLNRRGTQGFAKVISTNESTQISVATSYLQNWPFTGMKQSVLKTRAGITLEDSSYTYAERRYGSGQASLIAQVHLTQSQSQKKDLNGAFLGWETDSTPLAQYDSYGSPLTNTKVQLDAGGSPTSRKTTINTYENNANTWLVGLLKTSSTRAENLRSLPSTQVGTAANASNQSLYNAFTLTLAPITLTASRPSPGTLTASASAGSSGGTAPYSYAWSKLTGSRISIGNANSATASFSTSVSLGENFTETVRLLATDASGRAASRDLSINFSTPPPLNLGTNPATTLATSRGGPGSLTANASASSTGGAGGYSYSWSKLTGNRISISNASSATASFSANLGWSESFTEQAQVVVTDSGGNRATKTLAIAMSSPAPLAASLQPALYDTSNCYEVFVGILANVSGGQPPYSYNWTGSNGVSPVGNWAWGNLPYVSDGSSGTSIVSVVVQDAAGNQVTASGSYTKSCPRDTL